MFIQRLLILGVLLLNVGHAQAAARFEPQQWYWLIKETGQVYSAATDSTVPPDDEGYNQAVKEHRYTIIASEAELQEVLVKLGLRFDLKTRLQAVFTGLPVETQAALGPLAAAVLMFLENNNPEAAKLVIKNAQIPADLEPLRAQMLGMFP